MITLVLKIVVKYSQHFDRTSGLVSDSLSIISHVFFSNVLCGGKSVGSFYMTRGYMPVISGVKNIHLAGDI